MPFQFIDNNNIGPATRRRIRSHVAQGKNAGKKIARPPRNKAATPPKTLLFRASNPSAPAGAAGPRPLEPSSTSSEADAQADALECGDGHSVAVPRLVGDGLIFPVVLPSETLSFARTAFHFLSGPRHTEEMSHILKDTNSQASIWVRYMLMDEAYFHCSMATASMILNQHFSSSHEQQTGAAHHLLSTFRIVNDRLSGQDAASDQTIATVVGMAQYELAQRQHYRGFVHMQGLERLVKIRGGIQTLTAYMPMLTVKMFRADLEYALQLGSATMFSVKDVAQGSPCTSLQKLGQSSSDEDNRNNPAGFCLSPDSTSDGQSVVTSRSSTTPTTTTTTAAAETALRTKKLCSSPGLRALLDEMMGVASLLNDVVAGRHAQISGHYFHNYIILLGYKLLAVRTLREATSTMGYTENLIYLGLATFLLTFLPRLDRKTAESQVLSGICQGAALEDLKTSRRSREVLLWFLFITSGSAFKIDKEPRLVRQTAKVLDALGLESWGATSRILGQYPWVHALHGKNGLDLWSKAAFQKCPRPSRC